MRILLRHFTPHPPIIRIPLPRKILYLLARNYLRRILLNRRTPIPSTYILSQYLLSDPLINIPRLFYRLLNLYLILPLSHLLQLPSGLELIGELLKVFVEALGVEVRGKL